MMLTLFLLFSITIATLTLFSLKTGGQNTTELEITLTSMNSNFKGLIKSTQKLILLLIKDIFQATSSEYSVKKKTIEQNDLLESKKLDQLDGEVIFKVDSHLEDEDTALSGFSPQVLELIEEEEEKAA